MEKLTKQVCRALDCPDKCCTRKGDCVVANSTDPDDNKCYHYYSRNRRTSSAAPAQTTEIIQVHNYTFPVAYAVPVIIVGCLVLVILLVLLWRCWKIKNAPQEPSARQGPQSDNQLQSDRGNPHIANNLLTKQVNEQLNAVIFRIPLHRSPPSPYSQPPGQPYPQYHTGPSSLEENLNTWRYYQKQISHVASTPAGLVNKSDDAGDKLQGKGEEVKEGEGKAEPGQMET